MLLKMERGRLMAGEARVAVLFGILAVHAFR